MILNSFVLFGCVEFQGLVIQVYKIFVNLLGCNGFKILQPK